MRTPSAKPITAESIIALNRELRKQYRAKVSLAEWKRIRREEDLILHGDPSQPKPRGVMKVKLLTALPDRELLRVDEVAAFFLVHPRTVRRWIREQHLEAEKIHGSMRILRESVVLFRTQGREEVKNMDI